MLTHVHKVIHLVVGTFEQGLKLHRWSVRPYSADSLTVPPAPYIEKTGFHRVDRTLASTGPARPISGSSEDAGVGLRPDAGRVRSVLLTWQCTEKTVSDRALGESGQA